MRLTITILSGTHAGERFILARGETLRFGRTSKAEVVVADDPTMSAIHYELHCGDDRATIRDLNSRNGLFINGQAVSEAAVADGDQIRAGRTFFSVALGDSAALFATDETRAPDAVDTRMAKAWHEARPAGAMVWPAANFSDPEIASSFGLAAGQDSTLNGSAFRRPPGFAAHETRPRLYAIVDGTIRLAVIYEALANNRRAAGLWEADRVARHGGASPWLIEIAASFDPADRALAAESHRGEVLIESALSFDEILRHLRDFLRGADDSTQPSFRLEDPGLLYGWLKDRPSPQLAQFFGGLTSVMVSPEAAGPLLRLSQVNGGLVEETIMAD